MNGNEVEIGSAPMEERKASSPVRALALITAVYFLCALGAGLLYWRTRDGFDEKDRRIAGSVIGAMGFGLLGLIIILAIIAAIYLLAAKKK